MYPFPARRVPAGGDPDPDRRRFGDGGGSNRHGKTIVAEYGVWETLRGTGKVFYTTPIKALSNQKFRDLRGVYGDEVGLLTGDVTENRDARVIVMTTEILRNMLLQTPWIVTKSTASSSTRSTTWRTRARHHLGRVDHPLPGPRPPDLPLRHRHNADEIAAWIGRPTARSA
jgi:hypothetical protein